MKVYSDLQFWKNSVHHDMGSIVVWGTWSRGILSQEVEREGWWCAASFPPFPFYSVQTPSPGDAALHVQGRSSLFSPAFLSEIPYPGVCLLGDFPNLQWRLSITPSSKKIPEQRLWWVSPVDSAHIWAQSLLEAWGTSSVPLLEKAPSNFVSGSSRFCLVPAFPVTNLSYYEQSYVLSQASPGKSADLVLLWRRFVLCLRGMRLFLKALPSTTEAANSSFKELKFNS